MPWTMKEEETREHQVKQPITQIKGDLNRGNADPNLSDQIKTKRNNVSDAAISHTSQRIAKYLCQQSATNAKRRVTSPKFVLAENQEKGHD